MAGSESAPTAARAQGDAQRAGALNHSFILLEMFCLAVLSTIGLRVLQYAGVLIMQAVAYSVGPSASAGVAKVFTMGFDDGMVRLLLYLFLGPAVLHVVRRRWPADAVMRLTIGALAATALAFTLGSATSQGALGFKGYYFVGAILTLALLDVPAKLARPLTLPLGYVFLAAVLQRPLLSIGGLPDWLNAILTLVLVVFEYAPLLLATIILTGIWNTAASTSRLREVRPLMRHVVPAGLALGIGALVLAGLWPSSDREAASTGLSDPAYLSQLHPTDVSR